MKKVFVLFMCILVCTFCHAQEKKGVIELSKYEGLQEVIQLANNDFILKTGILNLRAKDENRYHYFDAAGNLLWERKITDNYGLKGTSYLVASADGEVVYDVQIKDQIYKNKTHYITQFRRNGEVKSFEISGKEEFGKNLQAIFCDKDYLYYLTTEEGWELNDKKKGKEKLILNRFSGDNISHKKFYIDLPPITNGKNTSFWSFIGQNNFGNYLLSKTVDIERNIVNNTVVVFNEEGKTIKETNIELSPEGSFLRPAYTILRPGKGSVVVANMDNAIEQMMGVPGQKNTPRYVQVTKIGAFGNLMLDPEQNFLYAYGLFGPKEFKMIGSTFEGFYLYKYDLEGNNLWKLTQPGSGELLDEKYFTTHATTGYREINLKVDEGYLNFSLHFKKSLFSYEISEQGKLLKTRHKDNFSDPVEEIFLDSFRGSALEGYITNRETGKKNKLRFTSFRNKEGEVLIERDNKEDKITVWLFKQQGL